MALLTASRSNLSGTYQRESTLSKLPDGIAGVRATLDTMIKMTRAASTTDAVRIAAENATSYIDGKDFSGQVRAVQTWVKNNIRYLRDHITAEMLIDPVLLLQTRAGDCDDHAMLVAAMLMSIGFPARFVAVGMESPDCFEHVFTEVKLGTVWLSVETTEPVEVGWQPPCCARMTRHI